MEAYSQQVALEQLKHENKDKARLAQKLAELEVITKLHNFYAACCHVLCHHSDVLFTL